VCEALLANALTREGLHVRRQQPVQLHYRGITLDEGLRCDMLVEHRLVVEIESAIASRKFSAGSCSPICG